MKLRARPAHLSENTVTSKLIRKRFPLCPFHNNQHFLDIWVTFLEPLKLSWLRCFIIQGWPTWHFKVAIVKSVKKSACFNLFGKLFFGTQFLKFQKESFKYHAFIKHTLSQFPYCAAFWFIIWSLHNLFCDYSLSSSNLQAALRPEMKPHTNLNT